MTPNFKPGLRSAAWLLGIATVLAGCAANAPQPAPEPAPSVTGSATYRERMALPPTAVFEATLEDVSRADMPSIVLGSARVASPQVPVSFTITYEPARIEPRRRYVVRARISDGGRLLFTTDTAYPVLGDGGPRHVDVLLRRVGGS